LSELKTARRLWRPQYEESTAQVLVMGRRSGAAGSSQKHDRQQKARGDITGARRSAWAAGGRSAETSTLCTRNVVRPKDFVPIYERDQV